MLVPTDSANSWYFASRCSHQTEAFDTMKRAGTQKPRNNPIRVKFREDRVISLVGGRARAPPKMFFPFALSRLCRNQTRFSTGFVNTF